VEGARQSGLVRRFHASVARNESAGTRREELPNQEKVEHALICL
jgi:hypothetical protein